ncbi:MAG: ABC transporter substrate-binding protein [Phycisphaerales bacterium]
MPSISRREFLAYSTVASTALLLPACPKRDATLANQVTLYTSADPVVVNAIVAAASKQLGLVISVVTDTEATKNMSIMQRLFAERAKPAADVWWSSEVMSSVFLEREKVLMPWRPACEKTDFATGWPAPLFGTSWYGVAQRARVIAFNTNRVKDADAPQTLEALCDPKWKGRIAIAQPQFGTTRTHIVSLCWQHGPEAVRAWLTRLKKNEPRLHAGNSAVVAAISQGEADVGLTDTDDVWAGQANQWPVGHRFEAAIDEAKQPGDAGFVASVEKLPSCGPTVIPNTVGVVAGGPHPENAKLLANFLVSVEAERVMAMSESRNVPIRESLAAELAKTDQRLLLPKAAYVFWNAAAGNIEEADKLIAEFFPV